MGYSVLAVTLVSISMAFVQAYQPIHPLFDNLQRSIVGSNSGQGSLSSLGPVKENSRLTDTDFLLEKQNGELEESLENLPPGLLPRGDEHQLTNELTLSVIQETLRQAFQGYGLSSDEAHDIVDDVLQKLQSRLIHVGKRSWNRFSVQTRFAPFGTKLVPNRKLENGGATLLRYGRSVNV